MNRGERTMGEPTGPAGSEQPQEERVRSLYAAAYPPAYPSAEPSEELAQRVAGLAARHDARAAGSQRGWLLPLPWGYAAGALAVAALIVALSLMLTGGNHRHST